MKSQKKLNSKTILGRGEDPNLENIKAQTIQNVLPSHGRKKSVLPQQSQRHKSMGQKIKTKFYSV